MKSSVFSKVQILKKLKTGFNLFYLLWFSQDYNSYSLFLMMQKKTYFFSF